MHDIEMSVLLPSAPIVRGGVAPFARSRAAVNVHEIRPICQFAARNVQPIIRTAHHTVHGTNALGVARRTAPCFLVFILFAQRGYVETDIMAKQRKRHVDQLAGVFEPIGVARIGLSFQPIPRVFHRRPTDAIDLRRRAGTAVVFEITHPP